MDDWLNKTPILALVAYAFILMFVAAAIGRSLQVRNRRIKGLLKEEAAAEDGEDNYVVTSVLGLLALLMGFTFALAIDRFETRRVLVLNEANAIRTSCLQAQLLDEPYRLRIRRILTDYTDNRISLAMAHPRDKHLALLARNDRLIADLWREASAAFETIKHLDFSSLFIEKINNIIELDAARKGARLAHLPVAIFLVLFIYLVVTAGVLGYVLVGVRGRWAALFMLALLTLSLLLVIDIDRPTRGFVQESQTTMQLLRQELTSGQ